MAFVFEDDQKATAPAAGVDGGRFVFEDEEPEVPVIRQGQTQGFLDRVLDSFKDPAKEKAKATIALINAEALGIAPSTAYTAEKAINKYYETHPSRVEARQRKLSAIKTYNDMGGHPDEWSKVFLRSVQKLPYALQEAAGNTIRMFEENPEGVYAMLGVSPSEEDMERFKLVADALEKKKLRTMGQKIAESAQKDLARLTPVMAPESFKELAHMATDSMMTNAMWLIPGLGFGRGVTLTGMAWQAQSQAYGQQREGGSDPGTAMLASLIQGGSEAATEFIPVGIYLKPRASFVRTLVAAEMTEIPTETVNQIVVDVVDKVTIQPDMTLHDAIGNIAKTAQVTALSVPGLTGLTYSANKLIGKAALRSEYADDFENAKNDALVEGATQQEAVKAGVEAVKTAPGGAAFVENTIDNLKKEAGEVQQPINDKPFIFGVNEDANGEVKSFTMADPVSGETFEVAALRTEDKDTLRLIPDMEAVSREIESLRETEIDANLDQQINVLIESDTDIDQVARELFGEQLDDVPDFIDEAKPETILSRVKAINDSIGEKGSIDFEPLVDLGRSIWSEGHTTIEAFTARAKELLSDVWDKVQYHIQAAWSILNNERGSVNIGAVTKDKGTGNIPPETTPKPVGGNPFKKSVIQNPVYHGGERPIVEFNDGPRRGERLGAAYFTDSETVGQSYADTGTYPGNTGEIRDVKGHLTKAYVDIKKPLTDETAPNDVFKSGKDAYEWLEDMMAERDRELIKNTLDEGASNSDIFELIADSKYPGAFFDAATESFKNNEFLSAIAAAKFKYKNFAKYLQDQGFDGFVYADAEAGGNTIIPFTKEQIKQLPNPTRPPEVGGQTLYSGVDPTQIIPVLKSLTNNIQEAMPHLEALGLKAYESGKSTYSAWSAEMKSYLGDLWESFKGSMAKLWESVKAFNERLGERGSFSTKKTIREATGQVKPKDKMVTEAEGLNVKLKREAKVAREAESKLNKELAAAFKEAARDAREAYRTGKEDTMEAAKEKMRKLVRRQESIKNIRDYFNLTDSEMKKISKKSPVFMSDYEFHEYKKAVELKAVELAETKQAKIELMMLIESKRLQKVDNYRRALDLPLIKDMTTQQLKDFAKLLEPFQDDDVFLTQRELETVDRTDLAGIRTWREARARMLDEYNKTRIERGLEPVNIAELEKVHAAALDSFRWDSLLRERDPFFNILVEQMTTASIGADLKTHEIESKTYELAKKSDKSRARTMSERLIPRDDMIMAFIEAPVDQKAAIAQQMTPEQINYANFMVQYFAGILDYLIARKSLERGRQNYFDHVRRTFLEKLRDGDFKSVLSDVAHAKFKSAFTTLFENNIQDQQNFNILDDDTGNILPLEKFIPNVLRRTDVMEPTTNVTRAFLKYVHAAEKMKMYDAIISKLDIYAQSLTPTRYTPRGLEIDRSLKTFVNKWINNKKGRRISFDSTLRQGGPLDVGIRALRTFTTIKDLGLSPLAQSIALVGEQIANAAMLGTRGMAKGTARMATPKGMRIIEKYRSFVGRSLWEDLSAPGKEVTERLSTALFAGFHASTVTANKQFLLASMTKEEYASETISPKRLAEMQLDMGRWRVVPGTGSLVGSTSIGDGVNQYKKWAIPITRTLIKDIITVSQSIGKKSFGEVITMRETQELKRVVYMTAAVAVTGALLGADDDDKSVTGKAKSRLYRELMSLVQGLDSAFWLAAPRIISFLAQILDAWASLLKLETYKTGPKAGELKGPDKIRKSVTPGAVRSLTNEEK